MQRKQQELVLNVWEKTLETMKFRAAKKSDFGTNLDGLYAPRDTPFDTALKALKELCGTPKFYNPCPGCVFLGNYESGPPNKDVGEPGPKNTWYDLYYCNQGHKVSSHMISARFGNAPRDLDDYSPAEQLQGMMNPDSTIGRDLSYLSAEPNKCDHPVLKVARRKAIELGLIDYEYEDKQTGIKV